MEANTITTNADLINDVERNLFAPLEDVESGGEGSMAFADDEEMFIGDLF